MQDFLFGRTRAQEAAPEPYMLYNKDQAGKQLTPYSETLKDIEYFRSMYPFRVKSLQIVVEEVFNEVDHERSPIYDEYPDRMLVERLHQKIKDRIKDNLPEESMEESEAPESWIGQTEGEAAMQNSLQSQMPQPQMPQPQMPQPQMPQPQMPQPQVPQSQAPQTQPPQGAENVEIQEALPHMPYGPMYIVQSFSTDNGLYKTWEMEESEIVKRQERPAQAEGTPRSWGPPPPSRPWGPPPPSHPWGPPPPSRPWGPPPPSHPWGPPPPSRPWGPPPPSQPWGPPPPPRPGNQFDLDDIIRLLLFGEMHKRRCSGRSCR